MTHETREKPGRYSPELRERAVRLVQEQTAQHASQWAAITAIAPKLGCTTETLRRWVRAAADQVKALEREVRELRRTNEILRTASAFFAAAALDRLTR